MSRIRGKDTKPEIAVRKALHAAGYRFRLNVKELPGKPVIVLARYKTVIFVHGCFWHRHKGCKDATIPTKNSKFWLDKFKGNMARDKKNATMLRRMRWRVVVM